MHQKGEFYNSSWCIGGLYSTTRFAGANVSRSFLIRSKIIREMGYCNTISLWAMVFDHTANFSAEITQ